MRQYYYFLPPITFIWLCVCDLRDSVLRGHTEYKPAYSSTFYNTDYFVLSLLIMSVVGKQYDLCTILPVS
jgi:hypothetical protein